MIIGIGIDIVEVSRLQRSVEKHGDRFLHRIFTQEELHYCQSKANCYQHFAVRFAAKEALLKAIGTGLRGGIRWREIEIVNDKLGKPLMSCKGQCDKVLKTLKANCPMVSLSHTKNYGIAFVVLELAFF